MTYCGATRLHDGLWRECRNRYGHDGAHHDPTKWGGDTDWPEIGPAFRRVRNPWVETW